MTLPHLDSQQVLPPFQGPLLPPDQVSTDSPGSVVVVPPLTTPQDNFTDIAQVPLEKRTIKVSDYNLVNEQSPSRLKKLASAIKIIGANVIRAVNDSVTTRRLLLSGLLGGLVGLTSGVLLMASLTGGLSMVTLIPSLSICAPAAVVGALVGTAGGMIMLAGYGVAKGLVRSAAYLWRSPEQRFLHDYRQAAKELESLEEERVNNRHMRSEKYMRIGILRAYLEPRRAECHQLLVAGNVPDKVWRQYGFHSGNNIPPSSMV
ncbi:hypothetical protein [Endozoicomonas sp. ALB091]|uniref:hypothetical protein n=1 Tax=Endozoicomonas sp. ALB091 TaxID=3403073 RepID=UPI003BB593EF